VVSVLQSSVLCPQSSVLSPLSSIQSFVLSQPSQNHLSHLIHIAGAQGQEHIARFQYFLEVIDACLETVQTDHAPVAVGADTISQRLAAYTGIGASLAA
jgi:hypothetical protein